MNARHLHEDPTTIIRVRGRRVLENMKGTRHQTQVLLVMEVVPVMLKASMGHLLTLLLMTVLELLVAMGWKSGPAHIVRMAHPE